MRSPIAVYNDWSRKREAKAALLERLRRLPAGRGIELSPFDGIQAIAAQELIREHPALTVVRMRDSLMLCARQPLKSGVSEQLHESMDKIGAIANAGDTFWK